MDEQEIMAHFQKQYEAAWEAVNIDLVVHGNAFLHLSVDGVRRIDPLDILKEAQEFDSMIADQVRKPKPAP